MKGLGFNHLRLKAEKLERDARALKNLILEVQRCSKGETETVEPVQALIVVYCEAWKRRYKTNPSLTGKSIGILKLLLKDFRSERAKALVQAYLKMNDSFYIKKRHDVMTLHSNIQAIGHYADSGVVITEHDSREMERAGKTKSLFDMVDEKRL